MIIRCKSCQTEFALDDAHLRPEGTAVQCSVCSEVFTVAAPDPRDLGRRPWQIKTRSGQLFCASTLIQVRNWILEGRLHRNDQLSRTGQRWLRLGWVPEFAPSFSGAAGEALSAQPGFEGVTRISSLLELLPKRRVETVAKDKGQAPLIPRTLQRTPPPLPSNYEEVSKDSENKATDDSAPEQAQGQDGVNLGESAAVAAAGVAAAAVLGRGESEQNTDGLDAEAMLPDSFPDCSSPDRENKGQEAELKPSSDRDARIDAGVDSDVDANIDESSDPSSFAPDPIASHPEVLAEETATDEDTEINRADGEASPQPDKDAVTETTGESTSITDDRRLPAEEQGEADETSEAQLEAQSKTGESDEPVVDETEVAEELSIDELEAIDVESVDAEELADADVEEIAAELDLSEDGPALEELARANKIATAQGFLETKYPASEAVTSVYQAVSATPDDPTDTDSDDKESNEDSSAPTTSPAAEATTDEVPSLETRPDEEKPRPEPETSDRIDNDPNPQLFEEVANEEGKPKKLPTLWPAGPAQKNGPSRVAMVGVAVAAAAAVGLGGWYLSSGPAQDDPQTMDAKRVADQSQAVPSGLIHHAQAALQSMNPRTMRESESQLQRALEGAAPDHPTSKAARQLLSDLLVRRSLQYTLASNVGGENSDTLQSAAQSDLHRARVLFDELKADQAGLDTEAKKLQLRLLFAEGRPLRDLPALLPPNGARDLRGLIGAAPLWRDPQTPISAELFAELEGMSQELLVADQGDPLLQAAVAMAQLQRRELDAVTAWSTVRLAAAPLDPVAQAMERKVHELRAAGAADGTLGDSPTGAGAQAALADAGAKAARSNDSRRKGEIIATDTAASRDGVDKTQALTEENLDALLSRGCRLVERGSTTQGIELLQSALDRAPTNIDIQLCLAQGYARKGRHVQALSLFNQVLSRSPEHRSALYGAATSSATQGDTEKALELYRRLVKVEPNHGPAKAYLDAHDAS